MAKRTRKIHLPTAAALGAIVLAIVALAAWGHHLGMGADALRWVQGAAAAIGVLVMAALPKLLRDGDGDGIPDVVQRRTPPPGAGPAAALLLCAAIAIPVQGCGASALRVHATIADSVGRIVDPACEEIGGARGRALDECAAEATADADAACVARAREHYAAAVTTCDVATDLHDAWCEEIVRAEARGGDWSWAEGLPFAVKMLELAGRLATDLGIDLPPELAQLAARGAP